MRPERGAAGGDGMNDKALLVAIDAIYAAAMPMPDRDRGS
jgi:hypothetical protein